MATREDVIEVLKTIEDPELFLDIYFLGLIYHVDVEESGQVKVEMTFTSPMCPAGPQLIGEIKERVAALNGVTGVEVTVVFVPPWQPSDEVKQTLGIA